jgi:hypothetical protein
MNKQCGPLTPQGALAVCMMEIDCTMQTSVQFRLSVQLLPAQATKDVLYKRQLADTSRFVAYKLSTLFIRRYSSNKLLKLVTK